MIRNFAEFELAFNGNVEIETLTPEKITELTASLSNVFQDALMNVVNLEERMRVITAIAACAIGLATVSVHMRDDEEEIPDTRFAAYNPHEMDEIAARDYN